MIPRRKIFVDQTDFIECLKGIFAGNSVTRHNVTKTENAFASFLNCRYALTTASGRDAILLALFALGVKPGDEILVPAYTLGELIPLLTRIELCPVPIDIEVDSFNIDINDMKKKITKKTKVILATHLFGAPCDMTALCKLARSANIFVIEDCAHSFGAEIGGRQVGTIGDIGIFSLEPNKPVSCYGGGVLVTNNEAWAKNISQTLEKRLPGKWTPFKKVVSCWGEEMLIRSPAYAVMARVLFSKTLAPAFERLYRGNHDRQRKVQGLSSFQGRIAGSRLERLSERNIKLNRQWERLAENFPKTFQIQNRKKVGKPAFYNFVALSPVDPQIIRKQAFSLGIDVGLGSEVMDDCGRMLEVTCPVSAFVFKRAVLLPLYESLSEREFGQIVSGFEKISDRLSL